EFIPGTVWPINYTVDWQALGAITDAAQIVDGKWELNSEGVKVVEPGYDRLIAIGDLEWEDYEVTVPVKRHSETQGVYGTAVGMALRWTGHYVIDDRQPHTWWSPLGALGWYRN